MVSLIVHLVFNSTHNLVSETPLLASVNRESAIAFLHDHASFQKLQPLVTGKPSGCHTVIQLTFMVGIEMIPPPPSDEWVVKEATSACPDGVTFQYRAVTIQVPMGPFWSQKIVSQSAAMDTEDGVLVAFQAPMGIHGRNHYRIVDALDGSGLVLREEAVLTGPRLLMPFTMGQEKEQHAKHRVSVAEELGRRAKNSGR
jgi:hypothetical protein